MTPFEAATLNLPPLARLLIPILKRLAKGYSECWSSNETLAKLLRCSLRTLRNALVALEASGLVRRVRDYKLRSRRRIELLFMSPAGVFGFMTANTSADTRAHFAASSELPPDPPIEVPEGNTKKNDGEIAPEAPPQVVDSLIVKAAEIAPHDRQAGARLRDLLGRYAFPASWVEAGITKAADRKRRGNLRDPIGYLAGFLFGHRKAGTAPELPAPPLSDDPADVMARSEAWAEEYEAWLEAGRPGGTQ